MPAIDLILGVALLIMGTTAAMIEMHTLTFYLIPFALAGLLTGLVTLFAMPETIAFGRLLELDCGQAAIVLLLGLPLAPALKAACATMSER
jgi:hypothetical protein